MELIQKICFQLIRWQHRITDDSIQPPAMTVVSPPAFEGPLTGDESAHRRLR